MYRRFAAMFVFTKLLAPVVLVLEVLLPLLGPALLLLPLLALLLLLLFAFGRVWPDADDMDEPLDADVIDCMADLLK